MNKIALTPAQAFNKNHSRITHGFTQKNVRLSEFVARSEGLPLACELVISAGTHVMLEDDLSSIGVFAAQLTFILEQDARFEYRFIERSFDLAQAPSRALTVDLAGPGAQATITCLCETWGDKSYQFKTIQRHSAPDTKSFLIIKGVLHDNSVLRVNNLIRIEKHAQRVKAEEQNQNLLLGTKTRVVSVPQLEALANDVSAVHGAAMSRIDEESLFYLTSRGLDRSASEQMLIEAFLSSESSES